MGVATITTVKADGIYEVQVLKNLEQAEIRKTELITFIANLATKISELNLKLPPLQVTKAQLTATITAAIAANSAKPPPNPLVKYDKEEKQLNEVSAKIQAINEDIAEKTLQKKTAEKRKSEIEIALSEVDTRDLWCLDYDTEIGLGDTVITVELNQESEKLWIAPRTYSPVMADVDFLTAKQAAIDALVAEFDLSIIASAAEIDSIKAQVTAKEAEITAIAASIPQNPTKNPAIQAIINKKNKEIDAISQAIQALAVKAIAEVKKLNKATLKKGQQLNKKAEIQKRAADLLAAIDDIFIPAPDQYTRWLQPTISSGGSAVFFNQGLLPGVQRWKPTYRKGNIVAVYTENDTADVYILPAISGQKNSKVQSIGINKTGSSSMDLLAVPVRYGRCNSAVFEAGDSVIVDFQGDWETPVVIGFASHPKECGGGFVYERDVSGTITQMLLPEDKSLTGSVPNHLFAAEDRKFNGVNFGQIDWTDHDKVQITWHGVHRYSGIGTGLSIFKAGHHFYLPQVLNAAGDALAGIIGVVAGAAFKNNTLFVFVFNIGDLLFYAIKSKKVIYTQIIGSYAELIQCVAISPDCTKASFISKEIASYPDYKTVVVDLVINPTTFAVSITNSLDQDSYLKTRIAGAYQATGTTGNIIIAVDYDKNNLRKTFFVESSFDEPNPTSVSTDFYDASLFDSYDGTIATNSHGEAPCELIGYAQTITDYSSKKEINFNNVITAKRHVFNHSIVNSDVWRTPYQTSRTTPEDPTTQIPVVAFRHGVNGFGEFTQIGFVSPNIETAETTWLFNHVHIDDLDLRYGLFAYTEFVKDGSGYTITVTTTYITNTGGTNRTSTASGDLWDYAHYPNLGFNNESYTLKTTYDFNGYQYHFADVHSERPLWAMAFTEHVTEDIFSTADDLHYATKHSVFWVHYGYKITVSQIGIYESDQNDSFSVIDKFGNKISQFQPIRDLQVANDGLFMGQNGHPHIFEGKEHIKIDKNNTLYSQTITNLKGIM